MQPIVIDGHDLLPRTGQFYDIAQGQKRLPLAFWPGRLLYVRDERDGVEYFGQLGRSGHLLRECNIFGKRVVDGKVVGEAMNVTLPAKQTTLLGWSTLDDHADYDMDDDE